MWLLRHQQNATRLQLFPTSIYKYPCLFSVTHVSLLNFCFISTENAASERSKQPFPWVSQAEMEGVSTLFSAPLSVPGADVLTQRAELTLVCRSLLILTDRVSFSTENLLRMTDPELVFRRRQRDKQHSFRHEQSSGPLIWMQTHNL